MNLEEFKKQVVAVKSGKKVFGYRETIRKDLDLVVRASPMDFHILMTIEELAEIEEALSLMLSAPHFDNAIMLEELADGVICIEVLVHALQGDTEVIYANAILGSCVEHFQRKASTCAIDFEDTYTGSAIVAAYLNFSTLTQHLTKMLRRQWESEPASNSLAEIALASIMTIRNGLQISNADWQAALVIKWDRVVQRAKSGGGRTSVFSAAQV